MGGFIYPMFKILIKICYYTSVVEWLKYLFGKMFPRNKIKAIHIAIDLYIVLKFAFVVIVWEQPQNFNIAVWYLLFNNVFTYLYYHVWTPPFTISRESKQRRFVNFFLAFIYSSLCFAFLYDNMNTDFNTTLRGALMYSLSNSLGSGYDMQILTVKGQLITKVQIFISFIFLGVILANTIIPISAKYTSKK